MLPLLLLFSCNNSSDLIPQNEIFQPIQEEENSLYVTNQWELSSPAEENFDEILLQEAFDEGMSDGSFSQSTLVIRNERIIHEEYRGITAQERQTLIDNNVPEQFYNNFDYRDRFSLASSWSVAKSFVSVLIGIAIDDGVAVLFINGSAKEVCSARDGCDAYFVDKNKKISLNKYIK